MLKYGFVLAVGVEAVIIVQAVALLAPEKAHAAERGADAPHVAQGVGLRALHADAYFGPARRAAV